MDSTIRVTNPVRVKEYIEACQLCEKAFGKKGVKFEYEAQEPFSSMANITVIGKEISIKDKDAFARICMLADNWEVYPFRGSKVQMTFMFYRLTTPLVKE